MNRKKTTPEERLAYRTAARIWLDLSELTSHGVPVECAFIGAYCYMVGVPVTVFNISKQPWAGSYRTAKRYVDMMVDAGALEYTEGGAVRVSEAGNHTSDFYFRALFEMPKQVAHMQPSAAAEAAAVVKLANVQKS
jgi:hypothetical protein